MSARERSRQRAMSLLRYAPGLVVLVIVIADSGQMTDTDLWGHIRFGQAVIAQRHLILRDPYSYSAFGHRWDNHEWLTEVVMAASYNAFGVVGLKLWKLACVAATMLLVAMGLAETGATPTVQLNTFTVVAVATMPQMEFRPQLFTFLLVAAMLALLARHNYRGAAPLWLLIPMMALWANLHGGFIVGIAILALYTAVAAIDDLITSAGFRRGLGLGALTIAALASTMITPYGRDTWRPVLRALRNPMTRIAVTDWQPLGFAMMRQWQAHPAGVIYILCGIGMLLAFVAAFALVPRGGDLPLVAIAGVLSVAAITAVRNLPIAVIACALPVARHSWLLILRRRERISEETAKAVPQTERSAVSPWLALAVAVILAIYSGISRPACALISRIPNAPSPSCKNTICAAIFSAISIGRISHLAYRASFKVFIDGCYDTVYPYSLIEQYIDFTSTAAQSGTDRISARSDSDSARLSALS